MCLTPEQLANFLNIIGASVTTTPEKIVVHATAGDAVWVLQGIAWCLG